MTEGDRRTGRRPVRGPVRVDIVVETASGEQADALRSLQAVAIREVLEWALAQEQMGRPSPLESSAQAPEVVNETG